LPALTERNRHLLIVVACALLNADNHILLAERPVGKNLAGLWEFPGGKLETGETPEAALIRELHEELGLRVEEKHLEPFYFASHPHADFHLLMPLYLCRYFQGTPQGCEGQRLAWVSPQNLGNYPMPPADPPLVRALQKLLAEK